MLQNRDLYQIEALNMLQVANLMDLRQELKLSLGPSASTGILKLSWT